MYNDVRYPIVRYTLTLEDYRHFSFYHNRTLAVAWLLLYFVLIVGTALVAGADGTPSYAAVPMGALVCSVIGMVIWGAHRWSTRRVFRTNPFIRQEYTLECGPNGIRVSTSSSDLTIQWKEISNIVEIPRQFAVFISHGQGFVIPKSHVDPTSFRRLLQRHVPRHKIRLRA